jgi:hypothetical protein
MQLCVCLQILAAVMTALAKLVAHDVPEEPALGALGDDRV